MILQTATRSALIGLVACLTLASAAFAQTSPPPLRAALPDNAEISAGPLPVLPGEVLSRVFVPDWGLIPSIEADGQTPLSGNGVPPRGLRDGDALPPTRQWMGAPASHQIHDLMEGRSLPSGPFTAEIWLSYHGDKPVGAALVAAAPGKVPVWRFGFNEGTVLFEAGGASLARPVMEVKGSRWQAKAQAGTYRRGASRYWHQITAVYDGRALILFHNGVEVARQAAGGNVRRLAGTSLDLVGQFSREPLMALPDVVKAVSLHNRALRQKEIAARFESRATALSRGVPQPGQPHMTSHGPLLQQVTGTSAGVLWETDRPLAATLSWARTADMKDARSITLPAGTSRLKEAVMTDLEPGQRYFYTVSVSTGPDQKKQYGPFAFNAAPPAGAPIVFAAISDTEARPHINAHLARKIHSETPQFLINVGDLTDGGKLNQRAEWTHEYLAAMGDFMASTPVLPVMGNGEDDFVWFDRYHAYAAPETSYYAHRHGDLEMFVLDSNLEVRDRADPNFRARQRAWFEAALEASTAKWKIVAFHHSAWPERNPKPSSDFLTLMETHGVDLVLTGHHHHYLRSWPLKANMPAVSGGPLHVQLGNGGGNISPRPVTPDTRIARTYQGFGYLMVQIFGDEMQLTMHDQSGAVRDLFEIEK